MSPPGMSTEVRLLALREAMACDLRENVLPFWTREVVEEEDGTLERAGPWAFSRTEPCALKTRERFNPDKTWRRVLRE
jgi:hypothetical protein